MPELKHILLINDDLIHNLFSQIILEDADACDLITVCQSVPEALEFLSNITTGSVISFPDLILLDINMHSGDAFCFLDDYHELNYHLTQNSVISIFTATNDPTQLEQAHKYPAVAGSIPKPLSMTTLYNVLTRAFSYNLSKQF